MLGLSYLWRKTKKPKKGSIDLVLKTEFIINQYDLWRVYSLGQNFVAMNFRLNHQVRILRTQSLQDAYFGILCNIEKDCAESINRDPEKPKLSIVKNDPPKQI